jgi:hypothetical protein
MNSLDISLLKKEKEINLFNPFVYYQVFSYST